MKKILLVSLLALAVSCEKKPELCKCYAVQEKLLQSGEWEWKSTSYAGDAECALDGEVITESIISGYRHRTTLECE